MSTSDMQQMPKKELWDRLGENTSQGLSFKDPLWDETVLFEEGIGVKKILYRSRKKFGTKSAKYVPRAFP